MKIEKGFTFITEAGLLLFVTKLFKNGKIHAHEFGGEGVEEVEYEYDKQDEIIGDDSNIVYGVIDNTGKIIKDVTSFYFDKEFANAVASDMNKHIGEKKKPYRVRRYYLIDSCSKL